MEALPLSFLAEGVTLGPWGSKLWEQAAARSNNPSVRHANMQREGIWAYLLLQLSKDMDHYRQHQMIIVVH